jgi:hypothetical protein
MSIDKYNTQIAKLGAMVNAVASEISNDTNLKKGEKFLLLQRIFLELKPVDKHFKNIEKEIKDFASENLADSGDGKSQEVEFDGASVFVKYSYPKDTLDGEKLKTELERAYSELNVDFDETQFLKPSTPRKTVVIQSTLNK